MWWGGHRDQLEGKTESIAWDGDMMSIPFKFSPIGGVWEACGSGAGLGDIGQTLARSRTVEGKSSGQDVEQRRSIPQNSVRVGWQERKESESSWELILCFELPRIQDGMFMNLLKLNQNPASYINRHYSAARSHIWLPGDQSEIGGLWARTPPSGTLLLVARESNKPPCHQVDTTNRWLLLLFDWKIDGNTVFLL